MMNISKNVSKTTLTLLLGTTITLHADLESIGDTLQVLLPVTALGSTYVADDPEGRMMFIKGFALNTAIVQGAKYSVDKWRPNVENQNSFPSAHTADAFGGAAFIQTRYGYTYGIPAYLAAILTGYSRLNSDSHYADDVVAGASIAMLSNWLFSKPLVDDVGLSATKTESGMKLGVNVPYGGSEQKSEPTPQYSSSDFNPDVRFTFEFGAVNIGKDDIFIGNNPKAFDFDTMAKNADPTTSIRSSFEFYLNETDELLVQVTPYEIQEKGLLKENVTINYVHFDMGDEAYTAYRWYEYRTRWRRNIIESDNIIVKAGVGLSLSQNEFELKADLKHEKLSEYTLLPLAHIYAGVNVGENSKLYTEVDAGGYDDEYMIDASVKYQYQISKEWDIGTGYRYEKLKLDNSDFRNDFVSHHFLVQLGYGFTY